MKNSFKILLILAVLQSLYSCKKGWLEAKSNDALVVPTTLKDFQALMDNTLIMNEGHLPVGDISADNLYLSDATWKTAVLVEQNAYIWEKDIFMGGGTTLWRFVYNQVFYANIVLDKIDEIRAGSLDQESWNNVKGTAYYFRADAFYDLAQIFAKPYNNSTASTDWGVPLKLKSDPNDIPGRATVQQTYDRIISDLKLAVRLLPSLPAYKTRPSKSAAYALLARTYLAMENYDQALLYADSTLSVHNTLLDYNTLNYTVNNPIPLFNAETIIYGKYQGSVTSQNQFLVDTTLFKMYDANDLRRKAFFKVNSPTNITFIGSYMGSGAGTVTGNSFAGIAVDEIYLIRAECYARQGNVTLALKDLNTLLSKRWVTNTYTDIQTDDPELALRMILQERRKELLYRNLRWTDLRRLNKDPRFAVTISRVLMGTTYTLPPNSSLYVFPIPPEVIRANPNMPQNER